MCVQAPSGCMHLLSNPFGGKLCVHMYTDGSGCILTMEMGRRLHVTHLDRPQSATQAFYAAQPLDVHKLAGLGAASERASCWVGPIGVCELTSMLLKCMCGCVRAFGCCCWLLGPCAFVKRKELHGFIHT